MAKTTIWVSPTIGLDTNAGTFAAPVKTISYGLSLLPANEDELMLRGNDGVHTLTANITITNRNITGYSADAQPEITGNFSLIANLLSRLKIENVKLTGTVAGGVLQSAGSGGDWFVNNCTFIPGATTGCLFNDTTGNIYIYNSIIDGSATPIISTLGVGSTILIQDSKISNATRVVEGSVVDIEGSTFIKCKSVVYVNGSKGQMGGIRIAYCTVDGTDAIGVGTHGDLIETTTGSLDYVFYSSRIYRNILYKVRKMVNKGGTGLVAFSGLSVKENWISSTTDLTLYTGINDITTETDPLFYSVGTNDYRIEMTSSCAKGIGGRTTSLGAYELDSPDTFFTSIPVAKVENAYAYKDKSRTNNKTGTAVVGETDTTKVLTTSTAVVGQYVPVAPANVRYLIPVGVGGSGLLNLPAESDVNYLVSYDNATKTGTKRDTSPALDKVVAGETWYSNSVLQTGTRVNIYALLAANVVQKNVDRGNGTFGTDVGALFNTALIASKLQSGYSVQNLDTTVVGTDKGEAFNDTLLASELESGKTKQNLGNTVIGANKGEAFNSGLTSSKMLIGQSATQLGIVVNGSADADVIANIPNPLKVDNRELPFGKNLDKIPALDIDTEANLPLESNTKVLTPNYGRDLNKVPSYTPDFPNKSNVLETDTTNGLQGEVLLAEVLAPKGTWVKADATKYKLNEKFGVGGISETGTYTGSGTYVDGKWVADGKDRGDGIIGSYGRINPNSLDISVQIKNNINFQLQTYLVDWVPFENLNNLEDNNFKTNFKRFGTIIGDLVNGDEIYGQETIERNYTIRLMTRFIDKKNNSDSGKESARAELITKMEEIRRRGNDTNFGNFGNVMNVINIKESPVQFNDVEAYAYCELSFNIIYEITNI